MSPDASQQPFISQSNEVPQWLSFLEDGQPNVEADVAARLLAAASTADPTERAARIEEVLRERPAVPLLKGLLVLTLGFARLVYRDRAEQSLNLLAMEYALNEEPQQ